MFFDNIAVPPEYTGLVIGKRGRTLRKIEVKHSVKIFTDENIFYIYSTIKNDNIISARNHISKIFTKKLLKEEKCPICLEKINMDKDYTVTECGHRFHHSCLSECLKISGKCPICRKELTEKKEINKERIIDKTILQVRRTNYILHLSYCMTDIYSFQLVMEEFLREPIRYALSLV